MCMLSMHSHYASKLDFLTGRDRHRVCSRIVSHQTHIRQQQLAALYYRLIFRMRNENEKHNVHVYTWRSQCYFLFIGFCADIECLGKHTGIGFGLTMDPRISLREILVEFFLFCSSLCDVRIRSDCFYLPNEVRINSIAYNFQNNTRKHIF